MVVVKTVVVGWIVVITVVVGFTTVVVGWIIGAASCGFTPCCGVVMVGVGHTAPPLAGGQMGGCDGHSVTSRVIWHTVATVWIWQIGSGHVCVCTVGHGMQESACVGHVPTGHVCICTVGHGTHESACVGHVPTGHVWVWTVGHGAHESACVGQVPTGHVWTCTVGQG